MTSLYSNEAGLAVVSSTTTEDSHVLKNAPGVLYDFTVNSGGSALWIMLFDAIAKPANGSVLPAYAFQVPINTSLILTFGVTPWRFFTGCTIVASTTGPFTLTASATASFFGRVS
jgi:hypothetical protein